jgi:hypothetical protein
VFGVILMIIWYLTGHREFFRRRAELAPTESVAG